MLAGKIEVRYGAGYDLAARRKNATRESTATLKAWLNEHKKNPYPTKGEKIMLAIITKMTLTQVSTWFANARRRLKKENKMTWEPKNKTDDDDDNMLSDEEKDKDEQDDKLKPHKVNWLSAEGRRVSAEARRGGRLRRVTVRNRSSLPDFLFVVKWAAPGSKFHITFLPFVGTSGRRSEVAFGLYNDLPYFVLLPKDLSSSWIVSFMRISRWNVDEERKGDELLQGMHHQLLGYGIKEEAKRGSDCGVPIPASKPKIWSLADTAACKTPPPAAAPWPQHGYGAGGERAVDGSANGFALPATAGASPAPGAYGRYGGFPAQYGAQHPCVHPAAFPDVQTDTPPQTPPNMKVPSVANPLGSGGGAGYCFPRHQQSPQRDPYHNTHHPANHQPNQPHHNEASAAFKPFYKR
ncbi:hypothetical protein MSG28_001106 [Choristoneura fumiferana]|uniref:Uncharacterized protein n=1 Tax=Choristoneura fumiferana TaxID=7141 RepID=A0ACC0K468_CHOFU|nr:hypothetical protein MSG28_001106 [Choristoneura fumiferana]